MINIYWLVLGLIAKLNTASASQQRRQRAAAAAAAASANRHSAQMAASKTYNNGANDSSLLNAAFQTTSDQSPDVIPHFTGGEIIFDLIHIIIMGNLLRKMMYEYIFFYQTNIV